MRVDSYEDWARRQRLLHGAFDLALFAAMLALYPLRVAGDLRERLRGLARQCRRRFEPPRGW
jgi:hypothetical protein